MFTFTPQVADAKEFPDLPTWATDEILYLNEMNVVAGYPDGTFGSSKNIKRADAALMLANAKKLDLTANQSASPFNDVTNKEIYYYDAVLAAAKAGYLNGYPDGTFRPNNTLTREEMAQIISVAYEMEDVSGNSFVDTSKSWASKKIEALVSNGITVGYPDGTFKPKNNINRAEFSVMLVRAMDDDFKVDPLKNLQVHFIDVGQGDSTLIQTPDGANILIDGGIKSAGQKVVSFLKSKDVGKLDMVVATHPHADHIGGLIPVLNAFKVEKFVDSGKAHTSQTYLEMLTIIDNKNIPFEVAQKGKVYTFDNGFKMTTIHADSAAANLNNASVSFKAEYNKVSFMFTGDGEKEAENAMINSGFNLNSTIYKAGHHGSNTSSTQAFINKVKPQATILSYGKGNSYGHPHDEIVKRLQAVGSKLYSTEKGDILVKTNGTTYTASANAWTPPVVKPDPKPEPEKPNPKPDPSPVYPVNINTASYDELQNITGVGPVIAQRIIDYRKVNGPFKKKSDLKKVKGIGDVTYRKMESQITI